MLCSIIPDSQYNSAFLISFTFFNWLILLHPVKYIIFLTVPLNSNTYKLLNSEKLKIIKKTAFIVNISRGEIIEEETLLEMLTNDKLAGAALDVFIKEPLPLNHEFKKLKNCLLSSHSGSFTYDAILRVTNKAIDNLFEGLGINK